MRGSDKRQEAERARTRERDLYAMLSQTNQAILLEARILAVADVVEAMSSHRPYRPALGIDKALAEIERGRGTLYDASVADACLKLFREGRYQLPA